MWRKVCVTATILICRGRVGGVDTQGTGRHIWASEGLRLSTDLGECCGHLFRALATGLGHTKDARLVDEEMGWDPVHPVCRGDAGVRGSETGEGPTGARGGGARGRVTGGPPAGAL